jgi:chorismate mutase
MDDKQLAQLMHHLNERFDKVEAVLATKASADQLNSVMNLLDANIREHERQEQERAAMNSQLNRLDKWMHEIAEKTGVTLSYE